MRFLDLTMQNFLAFGGQQTLSLAGQGLVVVLGDNKDASAADSNGAGKSSIMEAIVWVLYGDTMRGYKGDEVINRSAGKECLVSLVVEDDNKAKWTITRTRGFSKKKRPNELSLEVNGGTVQAGVTVDTQEMVNTLLGMDRDTFVHSVMLSYGTKPFAELADSAQKEVLENILQINQFARARDRVAQRTRERQTTLAGVNVELEQVEQQVTQVEQRVAKLDTSFSDFDSDMKKRRTDLLRRKAQCEADIDAQYHSQGLDRMLEDMKDMDDRMLLHQQEYDDLRKRQMTAMRLAGDKRAELLRSKGGLEARHQDCVDRSGDVNNLVGKVCPQCNRVLEMDAADQLLGAFEEERQQLAEELAKVEEAVSMVNDLERSANDELTRKMRSTRAEIDRLQALRQILHSKVQQRAAALNQICQLEQQVFNINEEIDRLEGADNPYGELLEEAKKEYSDLRDRRQLLIYKQRALDLEIRHLLYWERGFGNQGLKSFVIDGVLPFLNERAQFYADIMSGGDLRIEFSTQRQLKTGAMREEFQVSVRNLHGADVYKGNSDGEKKRINTAVGWAIGDLAAARSHKSISFKGLDEPFVHLDETGEDSVVKLLHALVEEYETILCVTHSDHLKNQFQKVITVVKENDIARIQGAT